MKPVLEVFDKDPKKAERQWASWTNRQRAAWLFAHHNAIIANDREIAKKLEISDEYIAQIWQDYLAVKPWADYEEQLYSILDRDLVADVRAVKLFDNMKDPRDPANYPEPPENIRAKAALLWPFK